MLKINKTLSKAEIIKDCLYVGFLAVEEYKVEKNYSKNLHDHLEHHFNEFFDMWDSNADYILYCDSTKIKDMGYSINSIKNNISIDCKFVDDDEFDKILSNNVPKKKIEYDSRKNELFACDNNYIYLEAGAGMRILLLASN